MTDRVITAVDEDDDYSTVDHVGYLNLVEKKVETDPFAMKNEEVRGLQGIDSNSKRRLSTQINKFQRGVKAESKQLSSEVAVTAYDAFDVVLPPHNLETLTELYSISSPHKAAVDAKVSNIVGLGYKFTESRKTKRVLEDLGDDEKKKAKAIKNLEQLKGDLEDELESFNEELTFTEILTWVWRDYETTGNGYIEIGRKRDGSIGYIGHIPAKTMRVRRLRDGFVQIVYNKVQFFRHFGDQKTPNPIGDDKPNEVIHIMRYSPAGGTYYGVPDIVSAQHAIAGNEFASRFNLDYFESKAIPRHLITLKNARISPRAEASLLEFFETGLKGQHHRSLFVPLPPDTADQKVELKIDAIEPGIQDASWVTYRKVNMLDILMVHRVPLTKVSVGDGVNLALAKDADKTFKEQVCAPEQSILERKVNRIIKELTDALELSLNEMTLTDADTQSKIDERDAKIGKVTRNELRARDGMPAIPKGDEIIDINKPAGAPGGGSGANQIANDAMAQRQRDSTRSANATDSAGVGRNPKGEGRTTQ